jgi:hypothetical protein
MKLENLHEKIARRMAPSIICSTLQRLSSSVDCGKITHASAPTKWFYHLELAKTKTFTIVIGIIKTRIAALILKT